MRDGPNSERAEALARSIPVRRLGRSKDVARAVAFFAAPEADFVTGQTLFVCGGASVGSLTIDFVAALAERAAEVIDLATRGRLAHFWQSFVDEEASAPYLARLATYLSEIASPGVRVDVHGMSPADRDFGRLAELRCAIRAISNGIDAERAGYDVYVLGHFQDPGLYELRSALSIPVIGVARRLCLPRHNSAAASGSSRIHPIFEVWHYEQAERYGLNGRVTHVHGSRIAAERFQRRFRRRRRRASASFADLPRARGRWSRAAPTSSCRLACCRGCLVASERGYRVGHAPVVNCASVALKSAEMWGQLRALDGLEPSRGPAFALASERAKADFQAMLRS